MNHFPKNVKSLRLKNNWTQSYIANILGLSIPAYSKMETGISKVTVDRAIEIAKIYEITIQDLLSKGGKFKSGVIDHSKNLQLQIKDKNEELIKLQKLTLSLYEELQKKE